MRRQRALLDYALGALRRRAAKHLALGLGLAFVVGLYASALFLAESLREVWRTSLEAAPDLVVQRLEGGRPALLSSETARGIVPSDTPGVRAVTPRVWGYLFVEALAANVTVVAGEVSDEALVERASGPSEVPRVAVGEALAALFAVHAGDRLAIPDARGELAVLEVGGVFHDASALQTADVLLTDEATARRLLALPEGFTDVALRLSRPEEAPVIAAAIRRVLSGARVIERSALARTYELTFDGRSGLLAALFLPCLAALLLLAWDRLSGLGDAERREIGVLKAIGWETRDVIAARLWESAVVAVGGAWLGVLGAYAFVFLLGAPGLREALFGWSALHPELELAPHVDAAQAWTLVGLVVLPFVGVSVVPAWRAASLHVDEAIR